MSLTTLEVFTVTMPAPPSVNGLFANVAGRGRVKTRKYTDWQMQATVAINRDRYASGFSRVWEHPVSVVIEIDRPRIDRDIDNCAKPVLDALVAGGIIKDDTQVSALMMCWADKTKDCKARVAVYAAGHMPFMTFTPSKPGSATGHVSFKR